MLSPVRESIWWSVTCAASLHHWKEDEANSIRAAKAWVYTPDETSRRFAEQMAEKAGLGTGAGWAAQAAFWSGGSMIKPEDPAVPPPHTCMHKRSQEALTFQQFYLTVKKQKNAISSL